jgi:hypothetical protein
MGGGGGGAGLTIARDWARHVSVRGETLIGVLGIVVAASTVCIGPSVVVRTKSVASNASLACTARPRAVVTEHIVWMQTVCAQAKCSHICATRIAIDLVSRGTSVSRGGNGIASPHSTYVYNVIARWVQVVFTCYQRLAPVDIDALGFTDALPRLPRWIICRARGVHVYR